MLFANLFRSREDRNLLMKVFVWNWSDRKTDWLTLATAELTYRRLVNRYTAALILPYPRDQKALAQLGAELANEMFGLDDVTPEMLLTEILPVGIDLCKQDGDDNLKPDYYDVIEEAIEAVRDNLN